jgi:hypothetical protein
VPDSQKNTAIKKDLFSKLCWEAKGEERKLVSTFSTFSQDSRVKIKILTVLGMPG